jgi:hypothetical protein
LLVFKFEKAFSFLKTNNHPNNNPLQSCGFLYAGGTYGGLLLGLIAGLHM